VSEWLLFNANSSIFQLYQQEQVNFQWDDEELHFVLDQHLSWIFKVLAHWNNNPLIDVAPLGHIILTLPPDLHPLYRGTIQGPLYVELVLQNYVQCFILHQTHIYVHRFKTDKTSSGNALTIYLQSIR
jgi:hypothetical protein